VCIGAGGDFVGCPSNSLYLSSGGLVGINTNSPNAELDVYGTVSATSFVGDGSGLTGVVASSGDRIVSGTNNATRMVAISDTGYISVTQAGANSAWFDPYRGLVTLGVSATGAVSATVGYFSGKVGAGTSVPTATLQVSGTFVVSVTGQTTTPSLVVNADGSIGIGNTGDATSRVRISEEWTDATRFTLNVEPSFRASADGSYYNIGIASTPAVFIDSGVSNSGYVYGSRSHVLRHYAGDEGRLAALTGQVIQFGHYNGTATGRITDDVRGLSIIPYAMNGTIGNLYGIYINNRATGGTITGNYFGLYQQDVNAKNYFGGRVGLGVGSPLAILDVAGTISASGAIQVGSSALACSAGIPGAIRYNSPNLQFCNGTTWTNIGGGGGGNVTGTGSATAVAFWSGSSAITYDSGLYWDNTNKRLGISTTTPVTALEVRRTLDSSFGNILLSEANGNYRLALGGSTSGGSYLSTFNNVDLFFSTAGTAAPTSGSLTIKGGTGLVGVGTSRPTATLQVSGTFIVSSTITDSAPSLFVGTNGLVGVGTNNPTVHGVNPTGLEIRATNGGVASLRIGSPLNSWDFFSPGSAGNGNFGIRNNANTSFPFYIVSGTGNVGISTTAPKAKLDVRGTISASDAIQVGSSALACSTGISGTIRYSQTSSTIEYCNSTAWVSMGPSDTVPISFRVDRNGTNQTGITAGAETVIDWTNSSSGNAFDSAGAFNLTSDRFVAPIAGNYLFSGDAGCINNTTYCQVSFRKNGSIVITGYNYHGSEHPSGYITTIIRLAAGDYVEMTVIIGGGTTLSGAVTRTVFAGALLGPQSGGGGATALSGLSDVNTSGATTGSIIAYDGSSWVVSSTGTSLAEGDRITSGTLAVVANSATSYVSLSTNGTTWGYFGSARSYLPNVSANWVSSTNISASVVAVHQSGLNYTGPTPVPADFALSVGTVGSGYVGIGRYSGQPAIQGMGTGTSYRLLLNPSQGNVGISRTNPLAKLDVNGTISASDVVQVGSSSLACSGGIPGAIRYNAGNLQYCNASAWTNVVSGTAGNVGGAGAVNHIAYWTAASTLAHDANQLFWNAADNRMGLGTNAPSATLHIQYNSNATDPDSASYPLIVRNTQWTTNQITGIEFWNGNQKTVPTTRILSQMAGNGAGGENLLFQTQSPDAANPNPNSPTTKVVIAAGGNVGISTTAPSTSLYVNGQIGGGFGAVTTGGTKDWNDISNARPGSGYSLLRGTDSTNPPNSDANYFHPFTFEYSTKTGSGNLTQYAIPYSPAASLAQGMFVRGRTSGAWTGWYQFPVIDPTGKMGINTNAPKASLDVVGSISATGGVSVTGNVQAQEYLHHSDRRLKDDIKGIPNAAEILSKLRGTHFRWKSNGQFSYGLIAQEVEEVLPELVPAGEGMKSVAYDQMTPILIEGWKIHQKSIEGLQAANDRGRERLDLLEQTNDGLRRWNLSLRDELKAAVAANDNLLRAVDELRREVRALKQVNKK